MTLLYRLSQISFEMDNIGGAAGDGFDIDCLDDAPTNPKDYIAIPFAEIPGESPHSLFCGTSLQGKTLSCKI